MEVVIYMRLPNISPILGVSRGKKLTRVWEISPAKHAADLAGRIQTIEKVKGSVFDLLPLALLCFRRCLNESLNDTVCVACYHN